jgi:hypothetical protein
MNKMNSTMTLAVSITEQMLRLSEFHEIAMVERE